MIKTWTRRLILLLAALLLSCGGGGGGDGSGGVGSGGTGIIDLPLATTVGAISGFGSIIVNGVRYDIDQASLAIEDAPQLALGMTVRVEAPVSTDPTIGIAKRVSSASDLQGTVTSIDTGASTLAVLGTEVLVTEATVFDSLGTLADLASGDPVQVHGMPAGAGRLLATRIHKLTAPPAPVLSGALANLDTAAHTFTLGSLRVRYATANLSGGLSTLANGQLVRVRARTAPAAGGVLEATQVQSWYGVGTAASADGLPASFAGVITDYQSLSRFSVLGTVVNAATAKVTGGPAKALQEGVSVEVQGTMAQGVLMATEVRIKRIPGTKATPSFTLIGPVGAYASLADFRVQGQPVDASAASVVFTNGTAANLKNGVKVTVKGAQLVNGVLIATELSFN